MHLPRPSLLPLYALAAALLSACAATPPAPAHASAAAVKVAPARFVPPPPPPAAAPVTPADQLALDDGIKLYSDGNYNGAIKQLAGADAIWHGGSKASQLLALKYTAFSYCVTGRKTLCRRQFEQAFKLDRGFHLEPGENGHPLWGPVFLQAQKKK